MSATKLVCTALAAGLVISGTFASSASATSPERASACVFDKHEPITVAPFAVDFGMDWGSYSFSGGAQLFVPAREGLTKEWLAASVEHALASAHVVSTVDGNNAKAICDMPRLKDVHVGVVSGGNGFWVQLISRDQQTSEALLKWARNLLELRRKASLKTAAR
jgi:hypothetical protein